MQIIDWPTDKLVPYARNPRKNDHAVSRLAGLIREFGFVVPILAKSDGTVIDGHLRLKAAIQLGLASVPVLVADGWTEEQVKAFRLSVNKSAEWAEWDLDLVLVELEELTLAGVDLELIGFGDVALEDMGLTLDGDEPAVVSDNESETPEPPANPVSVEGDVWLLGDHRIMCGDSTDAGSVAILMAGGIASLVHADPPYGMGKESDGVQNDNLYRDKLTDFQMAWWKAARLFVADNASAYVWGNPVELWRLWYGGLSQSERMTFRNEIVWVKTQREGGDPHAIGKTSAEMRSYPPATERCLFFVLGEQGFNNNSDNYWDGWDGVLGYLQGEAEKCGLTPAKLKKICGVGMFSHWFTKSQWVFIPEQHYLALQREYDGFKREYDGLKREFYATRAFFDNAHENMTDVWQFPRVQNDERHGHATPKPVKMIERAMRSSLPSGGLCYEPFSGSGTTIIAAEQTGRKCYAMEISPDYVDVAVKRFIKATGKIACLAGSGGKTFEQVAAERGVVLE